jgi:hypothetical protein
MGGTLLRVAASDYAMANDDLDPTPASAFDNAIGKWRAEQETPWMRIKHVTTRANLQPHLAPQLASGRLLRILDVGGGTGI